MSRSIPSTISTCCPELDLVWKTFAADILRRPHVLIADTEEELNWHAFLGHSIDMQGFRAAEFVGVDPLSKKAPGFTTLKQRSIGIRELAGLWQVPEIQEHLLKKCVGTPLQSSLDVLSAAGDRDGRSLVDAFNAFPYRKGHWTIRAYLQNCAALKEHDYSFRHWLKAECFKLGATEFPPANFRALSTLKSMTLEMALRKRLEQTFYQVGPALAAYILCDWQLGLWHDGRTAVFANFKLDSFHEEFVKKFSRGVIPTDEHGFAEWWLSLYPDLPPRLANECIWIGIEKGIV